MPRTLLRTDADTSYILNLCDTLLAQPSFRKYRFPFLFADKGRTLPVDAFYPNLNLVVEYHQGGSEGAYDQRRRDILLEHGVSLVEFDFADFPHDGQGRLKRFPGPVRAVLQERLEPFVALEKVLLRN